MILETGLELIYPHNEICINCGAQAIDDLCQWCGEKLDLVKGFSCSQCGIEIEVDKIEDLNSIDFICYECSLYESLFSGICAFGYYENVLKKMILDFKYHRKTYLSKPLAQMMANRIIHTMWINDIDAIVPVPLSRQRRRQRGFNQMELIGEELSKLLNISLIKNGLVRIRNTKPLKSLDSCERADVINGVFEIGDLNVVGRRILLIDDVFTTGSTLRECARVLLKSGTLSVSGAVLARAYDN